MKIKHLYQHNPQVIHRLFRGVSLLAVLYFLYYKVGENANIDALWQNLWNSQQSKNWFLLIASTFLMPINWMIETQKWRTIIRPIETISFLRATQAVYVSTTLSLFTPNRAGSFVARVMYLSSQNRKRASILSVWSNIAQLLISVLVGTVSLFFYTRNTFSALTFQALVATSVAVGTVILFFYLHPKKIVTIMKMNSKWWAKTKRTLSVVSYLRLTTLSKVLFFCMMRYFVFTSQFVLLLLFFGIEMPLIDLYAGVALTYLITTVIPSFTMAEFGIREVVALQVLGVATHQELAVLLASLAVWLINIIVPALIGQILLLTQKRRAI